MLFGNAEYVHCPNVASFNTHTTSKQDFEPFFSLYKRHANKNIDFILKWMEQSNALCFKD
jgi:hypothetical protein